jgi:hypothetical protein
VIPVIESLLGLVLAMSSLPKIRHQAKFETSMLRYKLVPAPLVPWLARIVAVSEGGIAIVLLVAPSEPWRFAALCCSTAIFAAFLVAVSSALARNMRIECGCFGDSSDLVGAMPVARLLVLIALAIAALSAEASASIPSAGVLALVDPSWSAISMATLISSVGILLTAECLAGLWSVVSYAARQQPSPLGLPEVGGEREHATT